MKPISITLASSSRQNSAVAVASPTRRDRVGLCVPWKGAAAQTATRTDAPDPRDASDQATHTRIKIKSHPSEAQRVRIGKRLNA